MWKYSNFFINQGWIKVESGLTFWCPVFSAKAMKELISNFIPLETPIAIVAMSVPSGDGTSSSYRSSAYSTYENAIFRIIYIRFSRCNLWFPEGTKGFLSTSSRRIGHQPYAPEVTVMPLKDGTGSGCSNGTAAVSMLASSTLQGSLDGRDVLGKYDIWLVVSNICFHIIYGYTYIYIYICMGCHPFHWRTPSFFKMVIAPPTRYGHIISTLCHIFRLRSPPFPFQALKSSGLRVLISNSPVELGTAWE